MRALYVDSFWSEIAFAIFSGETWQTLPLPGDPHEVISMFFILRFDVMKKGFHSF